MNGFGIEPIHDGNGNDKIMKIMPLPSQCERTFKLHKMTFVNLRESSETRTLKLASSDSSQCWIKSTKMYFYLSYEADYLLIFTD